MLERDGRGLNLTEQVRDGILNHTGPEKPATLEGRVVRIVDRVAYINHDIDDAVRAGIIAEGDLPAEEIELLGRDGRAADRPLVQDMVERSREPRGTSRRARRSAGRCCGCGSSCSSGSTWGRRRAASRSGRGVALRTLFDHYLAHPDEVPATDPDAGPVQRVTDYIAGMTDRFCLAHATSALAAPAIDWV